MSERAVLRKPWPELVIFGAGVVSAVAAVAFDVGAWFIASVFACIFAGLSVLVTALIGVRGRCVQIAAVVVGAAAVAFGVYWWVRHGDEPEIFSPILVGYIGGGVLLSGVLNLIVGRQRT